MVQDFTPKGDIAGQGRYNMSDLQRIDSVLIFQNNNSVIDTSKKASVQEALAGENEDKYMTPVLVKQAVEVFSNDVIDSHVTDTDNPHSVTKTQIGLSNVTNNLQATKTEFDSHTNNTNNPHSVTKTQVGLENVTNDLQATKTEFDSHTNNTNNPHSVTKTQVGLSNVLNLEQIPTTEKGVANGVATLNSSGKVPTEQLPAEFMVYQGTWNASTNTPTISDATGSNGEVYITSTGGTRDLGSGNITFVAGDWVIHNGTVWEKTTTANEVTSVNGQVGAVTLDKTDLGLGNVTNNLQATKTEFDSHTNNTNNPHTVTKTQVGLSNVTNDVQVKNSDKASTAEAETGSNDTKWMTPLKVKQAIDMFAVTGSSPELGIQPFVIVANNGTGNYSTIQAAVNAISRGTIFVKNTGINYDETVTLKSNVNIISDGATIRRTGNGTAFQATSKIENVELRGFNIDMNFRAASGINIALESGAGSTYWHRKNWHYNVRLKDITIRDAGATNGANVSLNFKRAWECHFENVKSYNASSDGLHFEYMADCHILKCMNHGNRLLVGIHVHRGWNTVVDSCISMFSQSDGFQFKGDDVFGAGMGHNIFINCKAYRNATPNRIWEFNGNWNASTNSPSISNATGTKGDAYLISTTGSRNLGNGTVTYTAGNYVVHHDGVWQQKSPTKGVGNGFYINEAGNDGSVCQNCYSYQNGEAGFYVGQNGNNMNFAKFIGCHAEGNGWLATSGTRNGFHVANGHRMNFQGCSSINNVAYGIRCGTSCEKFIVIGNHVIGNSGGQISLQGTGHTIQNNQTS